MAEPRFDILFAGETVSGADRDAVADNLGRLFKATPETVARLMGGGTHVLKRGADAETARKYESAMERAGARAILRECPAEATASAPPPPRETPAPPASAPAMPARTMTADVPAATSPAPAPETAFSLAPRGADVLAPHERRAVEAVVVDTRGISLASVFMTPPGDDRPPPPPAPDTSHISIAAPGADLRAGQSPSAPPPPPDTSSLSLAAPGARLGPEDERPPVPVPDLEGITLAPPGTPLEEIRPERKPVNPDISGLSLAPERR